MNPWNAVESEYIERLQIFIHQLHGADSTWLESIPVWKEFQGKTVSKSQIELFELQNHPTAKRCYAWSNHDQRNEQLTAVLQSPPIKGAPDAAKFYILQQVNRAKKGE